MSEAFRALNTPVIGHIGMQKLKTEKVKSIFRSEHQRCHQAAAARTGRYM